MGPAGSEVVLQVARDNEKLTARVLPPTEQGFTRRQSCTDLRDTGGRSARPAALPGAVGTLISHFKPNLIATLSNGR